MHTGDRQCQVLVTFPGFPPLIYRADPEVAARFAEAATRDGITISISPTWCSKAPPLPCARLWAA